MRPALAILASMLFVPAGCHSPITSICRQSCDCRPCTDADLQDCIDHGESAQEVAKKKSCDTALEGYLACVDDHLSCQQGAGPGTTECGKEEEALVKCTGTGNPFATPCQQAAQKFAMCNGQPVPADTGSSCPPDQACQSACVVQSSCKVINGMMFDQKFNDCVSACFTK